MPCSSWIFSSKVMRLTSSRARASESCAQTATLPLASTASRAGNTNLPNNLMNSPPRVIGNRQIGPRGGGTCRVVQIVSNSLLNPSTSSLYGTNEPGLTGLSSTSHPLLDPRASGTYILQTEIPQGMMGDNSSKCNGLIPLRTGAGA